MGRMVSTNEERIRGSPAANWKTQRTYCETSAHNVERRVDRNGANEPPHIRHDDFWFWCLEKLNKWLLFYLTPKTHKFLFS